MRARTLVSVLVLALAGSCGDPTGPLNGAWQYSTGDMTGAFVPDAMCRIWNVGMTLSHEGSSLTGRTSGGTVMCVSHGQTSSRTGLEAEVTGSVRDSAVSFSMVGLDHTGIRVGDQVVGTVTMPVDIISGDTVYLSGQFRLIR